VKEKQTQHMVGLQKTRETNQTKIAATQIHEENENKRNFATHITAIHNAQLSKDKPSGK
jgi:hypothetical protein